MAQNIKQLIQNYTKDVLATDEAIGTFAEYAFVNVVHNIIKIKPEDIYLFLSESGEASDNPVDISDCVYLFSVVRKNSSGDVRNCELIDYRQALTMFGLYEPSDNFPKAYIKNDGVSVIPSPDATSMFNVYYVKQPSISYDDTAIELDTGVNCPDKYFNIIIIKAAIQVIYNLLANKDVDYDIVLPMPPNSISLLYSSKDLPNYSPPSQFVPASLDSELFSSKTVDVPETPNLPTLSLPVIKDYVEGESTVEFENMPSNLDINRNLILPETPDIGSIDFGTDLTDVIDWDETENSIPKTVDLPTLSEYTSGISLVIGELDTSDITEPVAPEVSIESDDLSFPTIVPVFNTSFEELTSEFSDIDDLISKDSADEDIELANAHLQTVSQKLQRQQQRLQNQLHDFNRQNVEFQAKLQESINNANNSNNVKVQNASSELQEFSTKVQKYQIEINKRITEWQQKDVQQAVLTYTTERANAIQAYQIDVGAAINKFSSIVSNRVNQITGQVGEYRAKLEKHISEYKTQADSKISKWQVEASSRIQEFSALVNSDIQEFNGNVQKSLRKFELENSGRLKEIELENNFNLSDFRTNIEKEISSYTARINGLLGKYNANVAAVIQKFNTERNIEINRLQLVSQQQLAQFNSDLQKSVQDFQAEVKEYELQISDEQNRNSSQINNYQVEISKYNSEIQSVIQQANIEVQKLSLDYQWLVNQLNILEREFANFFFSGYQDSNNSTKEKEGDK